MQKININTIRQNEHGSIVFVALAMLAILTIIGFSVSNRATTEMHLSTNTLLYERTFYAAESGLQHAIGLLRIPFVQQNTASLASGGSAEWDFALVGATDSFPTDAGGNPVPDGVGDFQGGVTWLASEIDGISYSVTLQVYDSIPCPGKTDITYFLSIDYGLNWTEITDWDEVNAFSVNAEGGFDLGGNIDNWTPGNPVDTYRTIRVDFASMGIAGRGLLWRAELKSQDESCQPKIVDMGLDTSVASHGFFSRSSPVVKGNVIYSGSYETPALSWTDKVMRGHLTATRLYDPNDPGETDELLLWDAGDVLSVRSPDSRVIYFPDIATGAVAAETIGTGDGTTRTFSGTLAHHPISATTLTITDQRESFQDKHTDVLIGSLGGSGTATREKSMRLHSKARRLLKKPSATSWFHPWSKMSTFTSKPKSPVCDPLVMANTTTRA